MGITFMEPLPLGAALALAAVHTESDRWIAGRGAHMLQLWLLWCHGSRGSPFGNGQAAHGHLPVALAVCPGC